MNRIEPLTPTLSRSRTQPRRSMASGLLDEAHGKFQAAFAAAENGRREKPRRTDSDDESSGGGDTRQRASPPRRPAFPGRAGLGGGLGREPLPPRASSVLGIRSSAHDFDGNLRADVCTLPSPGRRTDGDVALGLDYVDLECLLQAKMKELNVQMPKEKEKKSSSGRGGAEDAGDVREFALRVREAAFLFQLCQQEIRLQFNISCPERARLVEQALDFWSAILECLVSPLDQARALTGQLQQRLAATGALASAMAADLCAFGKTHGHMLEAGVWRELPPADSSLATTLHANLRALAMRASYAAGKGRAAERGGRHAADLSPERHAADSPSPTGFSRASTSSASSRPASRHAREGGVPVREGVAGADAAEEVLPMLEEVGRVLQSLLGCTSAACRALPQQQHDKEDLQTKLDAQTLAAEQTLEKLKSAHKIELDFARGEREEAQRALAAQAASAQQALEEEKAARQAAETTVAAREAEIAELQLRLAAVQEEAEKAAVAGRAREAAVMEERDAAAAARTSVEAQMQELEAMVAEERAAAQGKLATALKDADHLREELARFTQEGVVLTPRPEWAGEGDELNLRGHPARSSMERAADVMRRAAEGAERITVLESEVSDLKAEAAKAREEAAGEVALRVTAQEVSHKLAGQLQEITDRPRAEAACGCPEPPADGQVVMVELSEYLVSYLSKRFGLQGHMASWEVEKMDKDLGWIMNQPVRCAVQS